MMNFEPNDLRWKAEKKHNTHVARRDTQKLQHKNRIAWKAYSRYNQSKQ
jgi:hypothetical protein